MNVFVNVKCFGPSRKVEKRYSSMHLPLSKEQFPSFSVTQVPGLGAAVLLVGLPTHPVWFNSRSGAQAATILPQLHRDHAKCS